jgi:hypothetical protein
MSHRSFINFLLSMLVSIGLGSCLVGCGSTPAGSIKNTITPVLIPEIPASHTSESEPVVPSPENRDQPYLFYLHGKIIEDQGLPATSPEFGEYQYAAILEKLEAHGFNVRSEVRPKDTDGVDYAHKVADQVLELLAAGVPADEITIVGVSKGGGIAIYTSHFLANPEINFVLLSICHPQVVDDLMAGEITLYGDVLSIYDRGDPWAGSCQELFAFSEGGGLSRHEEIVLELGLSHGMLYQPLDAWITPTVDWALGVTP